MDAISRFIELFDTYPLVALGEMHGIEQGARFIEALIRDPRFAERAQTIVVEFGNARHQALADAYVAGDDVVVEPVFHDFVGAGPTGFRAAIYPEFFATVREVNRSLPAGRRLRVLLGDPPLDWATASAAEVLAAADSRDEHFAHVAGDQRNALMLAGAFHLMRAHVPPGGEGFVRMLERERPGESVVVLPHGHIRTADRDEIDAKLAPLPVPSLLRIAGSWLEAASADSFFGGCVTGPGGRDPFAHSGLTLGQLGDMYLYLGPLESLTWSPLVDVVDRVELERRTEIWQRMSQLMPVARAL
ncbi:MAG TPA: hypothetical protein VGG28_27230 [Kofleriaceae bacterium]|jgi:hypothetical protein